MKRIQLIVDKKVRKELDICDFWTTFETNKKVLTQLERYEANNAPKYIRKFIEIGGGPKMGSTLEKFARFQFKGLQPRDKKTGVGYDHIANVGDIKCLIEQKSSGLWGETDFKWQHIEPNHPWNMLLLCGISYTDVNFWGLSRKIFNELVKDEVISNQGNKTEESFQGMWFSYSKAKEMLTPIQTTQDLSSFIQSFEDDDE